MDNIKGESSLKINILVSNQGSTTLESFLEKSIKILNNNIIGNESGVLSSEGKDSENVLQNPTEILQLVREVKPDIMTGNDVGALTMREFIKNVFKDWQIFKDHVNLTHLLTKLDNLFKPYYPKKKTIVITDNSNGTVRFGIREDRTKALLGKNATNLLRSDTYVPRTNPRAGGEYLDVGVVCKKEDAIDLIYSLYKDSTEYCSKIKELGDVPKDIKDKFCMSGLFFEFHGGRRRKSRRSPSRRRRKSRRSPSRRRRKSRRSPSRRRRKGSCKNKRKSRSCRRSKRCSWTRSSRRSKGHCRRSKNRR